MDATLTWDQTWILQAHAFSKKSKDPSTKVGCVIVGAGNVLLSIGFNGFPRNVNEKLPERWERPAKYTWISHAEQNCCFNAAREGHKLLGATAYLNWDPIPCVECTKAFIQSGIVEIVGPANRSFKARPNASNMDYQFDTAVQMLAEAGIRTRLVEIDLALLT